MNQDNTPGQGAVDDYVVQICEMGCTHVNHIIEILEHGAASDEVNHVPKELHQSVLIELKSIMSVYEARDD